MGQYKKLSITRGIFYSFAILLILFAVFCFLSFEAIHILSGLTRTIHDHPLVVSNAALRANTNIIKMHRDMKDVVLFNDLTVINDSVRKINETETETFKELQTVQDTILGAEGEKIAAEAVQQFIDWKPIRDRVIGLALNGEFEKAALITKGEGADHVDRLEGKMLELRGYARKKAADFLAESETVSARVLHLSYLFIAAWVVLCLGIAFFTTRRTRSLERELAEEKETLRVTLRSIGDGVIATAEDGGIVLMNLVAENLTGWSEDEAVGQSIHTVFNIISEDTREPCKNPVEKILETNGIIGLANHTVLIARDGMERAIADSGAPIRNEQEKIIGTVLVFRDQTEEREYRKRIIESENKYRLLSDNTLDLIWSMNLDLEFTYVNRAIFTLTGYEQDEWIGSRLPEHMNEADFAEITRIIEAELARGPDSPGVTLETSIFDKNREPVPVEVHGRVIHDDNGDPVSLQGITRDISERKRAEKENNQLEKQFLQAQKMESVGRLAGGVAHDFNNMLGVIIGNAELALDKIEPTDPLHMDLEEILKAAKRSGDITGQLLAFARRQTIAPKVLDLNDTVENLLKMLHRLIGEDIDLAWRPGSELMPVKIDPTQVDQILANLCVNARDAITGVGKITIETGNASLDEEYCADHPEFMPGEYVLLAVSDDGEGMAPETMVKIFEPFFTTKGQGRGTGLGLSTVYGIVRQNEGFINLYSEPGKGTTFKIYLPRHTGKTVPPPVKSMAVIPAGRGETVLLVEDEAAILRLGRRMLENLGYAVFAASTPGEALDLARKYQDDIHLLITDVVMPEMNGRELADQIKSTHPDLKILFMSGYTANTIAHRGVLDEGVNFIQKPFTKRNLAEKIRQVLEHKETA